MLIVVLVIVGGLSAITSGPGPSTPKSASPFSSDANPVTHGDLVVLPHETFIIQPTPGTHTYYQGGNVTVEDGGTLIVRNVTLSFVEFVSDTGTPLQRLSHIFHFIDNGTVNVYNSTVTTDVQIINAYAKLNVTVERDMTVWNSTLAFPGWLNVQGTSGDLTLNDSHVTQNSAVNSLKGAEPGAIFGDTDFAPSITVSGGAVLNAFNSTFNDTYKNNLIANANDFGNPPQPIPLEVPLYPYPQPLLSGDNDSTLLTPTDSANLTQDWLYPTAVFQTGTLIVPWTNPGTTTAQVTASVWYNGVNYPVRTLQLNNSSSGIFVLPLPALLLQNITHDGVLNYLNWTGDFGAGASRIAIDFVKVSGPAEVNVTGQLSILPTLDFDLAVTGAGSTLNVIDSSFDLNWNQLPVTSTAQTAPFPWLSNKLVLTDGATAYLANVTVANPLPGVFSYSAVQPDASSNVFFYRWAQFNLTGRDGKIAVADAQLVPFYAYSTIQSDNRTANNLVQNLSTVAPSIWAYLQYWDAQHGVTTYGESNIKGVASILLASTNLTGASLPDGLFLGGYHVGILVPAPGVPSHWFNWSVSPYPEGVAQTPPAVAGPDYAPPQEFPQYYGAVTISSVGVHVNGVASTTINLGQNVSVIGVVTDIGSMPITQIGATLFYNTSGQPSALLATYENTTLDLTAPGQVAGFTLDWTATLNVTHVDAAFDHNFTVALEWNYNTITLGGGNVSQSVPVKFAPTLVSISATAAFVNGAAATEVDLGQTLTVRVTVKDIGNSTITDFGVSLAYNQSHSIRALLAFNYTADLGFTSAGQTASFDLSWKSTENITGLHGWFVHNFSVEIAWNDLHGYLGNGSTDQNVSLEVAPSQIAFVSFSPAPNPVSLTGSYLSTGKLAYNGSQPALVELFAYPVQAGLPSVVLGSSPSLPGNFTVAWSGVTQLTAGTTYTLVARASYNSRETNLTVGTFAVPAPSSSPTNILTEKILGLPLWVWIAIAAAAAVAIVLFLFFARRQAAGKLVECGECGNLIPEDATVCPKCGAEFESDLIRCSRCASTIPANSKFCPECAAQLLGTPGEAAADPEKQAYADFTEKYRAAAKRELGDNYSEGAFWDWWKRQPTYTSFSQWSLQQGQGTPRAGMTAPPAGTQTTSETPPSTTPPRGGGGGAGAAPMPSAQAAPSAPAAVVPPPAAGGAGLKACPSCGKEIPAEYLVCPFCNAVTS